MAGTDMENDDPEYPPPQCDENTEIAVNCVDDGPSDYCPKSEDNSTNNISMSSNCDKPGCKCRFNYKRLENGTCVPADDCPPFNCSGPNEEYDSCPPYCPGDSCSQASPTGLCHIIGRIGIVVECRPKCRCIKGYWRNDDGNCIPYAKCPGICPDNEEYTNCTQAVCRATNCSEIVDIAGCFNNDESECRGGCVCIENYLRNDDGTCVPKEQCVTNITPQCDDTETAVKCVTYGPSDSCARSNEGDNDYNQVPSDCDNPGCKCGFNYRRSLNGTCIPARDCPPFNCTGPNEEYNPCPPYCPGDGCSQATPTGRCPIFGTIGIVVECRPTCRCIKGYWRNVAGECIPYAECPGICPDNEEYTNCTQAVLRATNCSRRFDIADHFNSDESECQGGCVCKENYLRNENGSCVSAEQCENNNEQKHNNKNIPIERKRAHHKLAFRFYRRHPFLRWINVYPAAVVYTDIDYNQ